MVPQRSLTWFLLVSIFLLVIPFIHGAITLQKGIRSIAEMQDDPDSSSGEAEISKTLIEGAYQAPSSETEEKEEKKQMVTEESLIQGHSQGDSKNETQPPVVAVGVDGDHLPRHKDEDYEGEEEDGNDDDDETEKSTTAPVDPSTGVPRAALPVPVPANDSSNMKPESGTEQDPSSHNQSTETVDHANHHFVSDKPEEETVGSEDKQSEEKTGRSSGSNSDGPHSADRSVNDGSNDRSSSSLVSRKDVKEHGDRPDLDLPSTVNSSSERVSSKSIVWLIVFGVVSSALLMSGMNDQEEDDCTSWNHDRRRNFKDFNPYAWSPTPTNQNTVSLHSIT